MSKNMKTYIALLVTLVLALVLFFMGAKVVKHSKTADQDMISANVTHLANLEDGTAKPGASVAAMEAAAQDGADEQDGTDDAEDSLTDVADSEPEEVTDTISEEEEQRKILALYDEEVDYAQIRRWFNGNVIVGDSIAEAATTYEYLDHSVDFAEIGVTAETGKDEVDRAIAVAPEVMIMSFGVNDIENDTLEDFIAHYRARISEVQQAIPETKLYIHTIFPPINGLENELTFYQNLDEYNAKLKELCEEMNVPLVDGSFILINHQDLYDGDGVHPLPKFYHLWLTYLADVTGLSHE